MQPVFPEGRAGLTYFIRISEGEALGNVAEINLAEFYYKTCQALGRQTADTRYNMVIESEIEVVNDPGLDRSLVLKSAGENSNYLWPIAMI